MGELTKLLNDAISKSLADAKADSCARFSAHLDGLIRHITKEELSSIEIIELLHHESLKFHSAGFTY
ncbi:DUF2732 family protein [Cedecea sp. NFIX57]|uniref:DUF2732 family protein n=1 Tax=Cedecea sp. NFIX57 TaxID=1566286 RepID=UPI0020CB59F0|nr:DUF2732 family protein [Cedecea sp. NFIX57]